MDLWIQPCARCADLYGQPSTIPPHKELALSGTGFVKNTCTEEHYTCIHCSGVFARIMAGPAPKQMWMLLNAGQH